MSGVPLIIVVGGDALAIRVCEELCGTQGHRVALLWMHSPELAEKVERLGAGFVGASPNDYDALRTAGVTHAASIMVLDEDDRLNLQVALKARDLNPEIRLVLRQFNRTLGRKIEQNLPNCSVLSLAAHAASTFVSAALDRACFYALQFPDLDGVLTGFSQRRAAEFGVAGVSIAEAQTRLCARIIGVGGKDTFDSTRMLYPDEELVVFGRIAVLETTAPEQHPEQEEAREAERPAFREVIARGVRRWRRVDPILKRIAAAAAMLFVVSVLLFTFVLHRDLVTTIYFVLTTMTTVGYGDVTPLGNAYGMLFANFLMIAGVALSGIFIAFATSALTRAQFVAMQGLRQIRTQGHVIVCGSGNVGTRVIDFLLEHQKKLVVIDNSPGPALIEASRNRRLELLTGDATSDVTLDLCNLTFARALIALTDSDTANLEVTLGARARNPNLPVVMRIQDDTFARSIARQFGITTTFSTSALAAPAFAGLSRFPGSRGRIAFGDDEYNIGERQQAEIPAPPPADHCIALGVWRKGRFLHIDRFDEMEPFDRLLFVVPLSQFRTPKAAPVRDDPAAIPVQSNEPVAP
ncbi:MAG: NAD-binding protein [Candidatus Velthaea sp.]